MDIASLHQKLNATNLMISKVSKASGDGVDQALLDRISALETSLASLQTNVNNIQNTIIPNIDSQIQTNTGNLTTNYNNLDSRVTALETP